MSSQSSLRLSARSDLQSDAIEYEYLQCGMDDYCIESTAEGKTAVLFWRYQKHSLPLRPNKRCSILAVQHCSAGMSNFLRKSV